MGMGINIGMWLNEGNAQHGSKLKYFLIDSEGFYLTDSEGFLLTVKS